MKYCSYFLMAVLLANTGMAASPTYDAISIWSGSNAAVRIASSGTGTALIKSGTQVTLGELESGTYSLNLAAINPGGGNVTNIGNPSSRVNIGGPGYWSFYGPTFSNTTGSIHVGSVTATQFVGTLSGTATTAENSLATSGTINPEQVLGGGVTLSATQTLSNKTLASSIFTGTSSAPGAVIDLGSATMIDPISDQAAMADCNEYLRRIFGSPTTAMPTFDFPGVFNTVREVYATVGRENVFEMWFLRTDQNNITSGTVPAFLSGSNNGTPVGTPTFSGSGVYFSGSTSPATQRITLPQAPLNAWVSGSAYTIISAVKPVNGGVAIRYLESASLSSGTHGGLTAYVRWNSGGAPNAQACLFQIYDDTNTLTGSVIQAPNGLNWTVPINTWRSGEQKMYLEGRLMTTGTYVGVTGTTNRQLAIGGGIATNNSNLQWNGSYGNVACLILLKNVVNDAQAARLADVVRACVSKGANQFNVPLEGDSISGGYGGSNVEGLTPSEVSNGNLAGYSAWWGYLVCGGTNWGGKGAAYSWATGGNTIAKIVDRFDYETQARRHRPNRWITKSYATCWAGTNDIANGSDATPTAATVHAKLREYWAKAKADGNKVIAFTILDRVDVSSAKRLKIQAVNDLIRADQNTGRFDYLVDLYSTFAPNGASQTYPTALLDGLHPYDAGHVVIANYIDGLITNP